MEDMMFGFLLFVLCYGFLGWLFLVPAESEDADANAESSAWEMNQSDDRKDDLTTTVNPQLKDLLQEVTETVTVTEVPEKPTVEELLDGIEVEKITLRKARKIASRLGIKQKVNSKDQPKSWLVAQIAKRLEATPIATAAVIKEVYQTAA